MLCHPSHLFIAVCAHCLGEKRCLRIPVAVMPSLFASIDRTRPPKCYDVELCPGCAALMKCEQDVTRLGREDPRGVTLLIDILDAAVVVP